MRKSLIEVGLAPKGGNYNRCHKLKKEFLGITPKKLLKNIILMIKYDYVN